MAGAAAHAPVALAEQHSCAFAACADLTKEIVADVQQPILGPWSARSQGGLRGHRQGALSAP